jgi:hypothetical protein
VSAIASATSFMLDRSSSLRAARRVNDRARFTSKADRAGCRFRSGCCARATV